MWLRVVAASLQAAAELRIEPAAVHWKLGEVLLMKLAGGSTRVRAWVMLGEPLKRAAARLRRAGC